ncbi:MAG: response regulator [Chloracidobacterium sp.]|uniref:Response regulator n=1 Tax=Chloracidobacterium validum TaxID=2821543 RepID=A0ABX8B9T8_9BACT|nr:response regulator [Chloracidobacterium validum]QUW03699.1 response regulator [Chloracidobacterium validum]
MKQVLLVEDDSAIVQIVSKWLSRHREELNVVTAEHGRAALEILAQHPVDIVVTDLQMPVMDGFELIAHLLSEQIQLPIIVMTAMAVSDAETRLSNIGAFPVLRKPLSITTLYNTICNELDARRQGVIQGLTLASFLQLLEVERKSCVLRVTKSGRVGYLYFEDGALIHAETGEVGGEAAAFDILLWEGVQLQMTALPAVPPPRTLHDRLMGLLMEAFRRRDEAEETRRRATHHPPSDQPRPTEARRADAALHLAAVDADWPPHSTTFAPVEQHPARPTASDQLTEEAIKTAESVLQMADRLVPSTDEESKIYAVNPELRRRIENNELPQQTAKLLRLFDGRLTLGEILSIAPEQSTAITFLVNGLKVTGLLREVEPGAPSQPTATALATEDLPPLSPSPDWIPPTAPYLSPSDALLLTQALALRSGYPVPPVAYVCTAGLPAAYAPVLAATLRRIREVQQQHLSSEVLDVPASETNALGWAELEWVPLRPDLRLVLLAPPPETESAHQSTGPKPPTWIGSILFTSNHDRQAAARSQASLKKYRDLLGKSVILCVLNSPFTSPGLGALAEQLSLPAEQVGTWDIQSPEAVTSLLRLVIQHSLQV